MQKKKAIVSFAVTAVLLLATGFVFTPNVTDVSATQWTGLQGPMSIAIRDYDNDGLNDLAFSEVGLSAFRATVYKSDGTTILGQWSEYYLNAVAMGDYDNDGVTDLAISSTSYDRVTVYKNDGVTIIKQITGVDHPTGLAIDDYDNDGLNDIAIVEHGLGRVTVYESDGSTIIKQWAGLNYPILVAIGDYNNDGLNDLAFSEASGNKVTVYKSDGTTIIKQWTGLNSPRGVAIGDYNNDGQNDLAFSEYNADKITVYQSDGTTIIKQLTADGPQGIAIGDYNNDGLNDLALAEFDANRVIVYYQTNFAPMLQWTGLALPYGVSIGDYDDDGLNDIAFSEMGTPVGGGNYAGKLSVYKSDGVTLIKQWTGLTNLRGVEIGDYNNDGSSDIAFARVTTALPPGGGDVTVYKNDGVTLIKQWTGLGHPLFISIGDYDNDGSNDIAFTEYYVGNVTVYKSDGVTVIKRWTGLNDPCGVAIGDYDNDGLNDLAFVETGYPEPAAGCVTVYKSDGVTVIKQWVGLSRPTGVAIGDYDNDGLNDLAFSEQAADRVTVYKSDGTTVIKQLTGLEAPAGVAIGDFNNDGLFDLALCENDAGRVIVYYQTNFVTVFPKMITGPPPKIGETFDVNITIADVIDLYDWQAGMTFNASVLECVSIAEGEFLKRASATTLWTPGSINNDTGTINYSGCSRTGAASGVTGTGQLMSVTFKVKGNGNSTLHLTDVILLDSDLASITPVTIVDGHVEIHAQDISILSVTKSATEAYPTWIVPYNVTVVVENQGTRTETFNVTAFASAIEIGKQEITLDAGANTTLEFSWNLAGVAEGTYTVRAEATVLYGEIDTSDNTVIEGTVKIKHPGDANDDTIVNAYDLGILAKAWTASGGTYDARADFNGDETIDTLDHDILKAYWP